MSPLTPEARANLPMLLPQWHLTSDSDSIERTFIFEDFAQAWAFMTHVARLAEQHDHHPEWSNVYNRVTIRLTTHDAKGLTDRDLRLATAIDRIPYTPRPGTAGIMPALP